ncbi:hypothetical protein ABH931_007018 [Streptacidiphilus sp. MAP12-33]|uniref:hypothetical protein n=1 Tax=Streptacidiphilus sp. MAP12-33 TaxID=3156266 RepID=UPI0035113F77
MLYSENLAGPTPTAAAAAADATEVAAALGPRLDALACENEPNLFAAYHLRPPQACRVALPAFSATLITLGATP